MSLETHVLLAGRSAAPIKKLAKQIEAIAELELSTRHIQNGHSDPLYGLDYRPDVVVMLLNDKGHADLEALIEDQTGDRPPLIVLAEQGDSKTMRLAMQAGARDFLHGTVDPEEVVEAIDRITLQAAKEPGDRKHRLTAFVNAKGGSGATFVGCNIAHVLKAVSNRSTALLSLDMQFDSLAQYFDTDLKHGLVEVLDAVDSLDAVSLDAYMTQHHSGLRMLAAQPEDVIQCHADQAERLGMLLDTLEAHYEHLIVDMPRRVDPYHIPVLERADRVVLVVQQTLGHLRDAARMLQIFANYGVEKSQILVVVNRYDKDATITTDEISRALPGTEIATIPSDFQTVAESINLGIPMHEHARGSAVTKALLELETKLGGNSAEPSRGFFKKAISNILRKGQWSRA
ncbi:MAG: AAA family ATPase [Gammaproteobacteria bacterium]|jgi:pilus assembly protein CpaE